MRQASAVFVGLVASCGVVAAALAGVRVPTASRGMAPALASESAALFVGVREFPEDETLTVVQ